MIRRPRSNRPPATEAALGQGARQREALTGSRSRGTGALAQCGVEAVAQVGQPFGGFVGEDQT
jgi:hypothetical protein